MTGATQGPERYDPPEEKIAEVLRKTGGDPRKLAIAYLRSQKRARDAETAFGVMGDITDLTFAAATRNVNGASAAVESAKRRLRRHTEVSE